MALYKFDFMFMFMLQRSPDPLAGLGPYF